MNEDQRARIEALRYRTRLRCPMCNGEHSLISHIRNYRNIFPKTEVKIGLNFRNEKEDRRKKELKEL